jgi:hypothetical protein
MFDPLLYAHIWKFIGRSLSGILPVYSGRVYYQTAPVNTEFPMLVYQPVVNQSYATLFLDDSYWQGLVTFRSVATDFAVAQDKLALTIADLVKIKNITISGVASTHTVRYDIAEVPSFPVDRLSDGYVYTAAVTMEVYIFPTDY